MAYNLLKKASHSVLYLKVIARWMQQGERVQRQQTVSKLGVSSNNRHCQPHLNWSHNCFSCQSRQASYLKKIGESLACLHAALTVTVDHNCRFNWEPFGEWTYASIYLES
jgi:hypothetical protein